ncbi:hypothetical protein PR202_gb19829 [Eleusine coracana subsp. coracana]|uniref:Phylloplanin n=1 Tax=Eleusine coracana subsp. coracana TaxID=191504 RepID=A0AAV5F8Y5_ELECO|nr:hypothetical protein QOZ80_3BG0280500 [Eleusine coracana subsp. coracana]GJN31431.1 hypothetical protein PR202_gb19829 [Eleusine coracana subsp. coracana]
MAPKSFVLAALLLLLVATIIGAEAATTASGNVAGTVVVSGNVPCSNGTNINVASVPAFPNATVQLICSGNLLASATTNANGSFGINVQLGNIVNLVNLVTALLGNQCNVVVATPLVACNASLANVTGTLAAPVRLLGSTGSVLGGVVTSVVTEAFSIV